MSGPTKIYLVLVTLLLAMWMAMSTLVSAGRSGWGPGGPSGWDGDLDERMRNSHLYTAVLRGRVQLRDAAGHSLPVPEGTLVLDVRPRSSDGTESMPRIAEIQRDGLFEVNALPHGSATLSVLLGGGESVWRLEDIVVGAEGVLDPRIDPIDLGDRLFPITLHVAGPSGEPVPSGRLAWRPSVGHSDDQTFAGIAPIIDGQATFLTTSALVDAVCLVPGARAELFEGLFGEDTLDLGPGTTVEVVPLGSLPDPAQWSVRAVLVPEELRPRIEVDSRGYGVGEDSLFAELDRASGVASIPVPRAGNYRLRWWVVDRERQRFQSSLKLDGSDEDAQIEVPLDVGAHTFERRFPIEAFVRRTPARRR